MSDKVIIFDTTLRDGEQSPGASMNAAEKLRLAIQLEKLGVDVIEAGFPAASEGDFESVLQIAKKMKQLFLQLYISFYFYFLHFQLILLQGHQLL